MDTIDTYFPYSEYRPGQRHMLEVAAAVARDGGIAMIDAPTGSGKSSVVASLLAERKKRKIVIAVRTISQLTTFIRELELVKKKQPQIKTVYLVGKKSMCPLGGEGDVYRRCEGVKAFSNSLMRDRAEKGALTPSKTRSSSSRSGAWTGSTRSSARITSRARCSYRPRPWASGWSPRQSCGPGQNG